MTTWWAKLVGFVLGAGAIATAVTAIVGLWPEPDAVDRVVVTSSDLTGPEQLSNFAATATIRPRDPATGAPASSPAPRGRDAGVPEAVELQGAGQTEATETPELTQSTGPSTDETSTTVTTDTVTTETDTSPPTTSSASTTTATGPTTTATVLTSPPDADAPPLVDLPGSVRDRLYDDIRSQAVLEQYALPDDLSSDPPGVLHVAVLDALNQEGEAVAPQEAAEQLVARLETVRNVSTPVGLDPLGVRVAVNLEVEGLRGETLVLYWRLVAAGGTTPVPPVWAEWVPAYAMTPGTDLDSAAVSMWVPLPEAAGPYRAEMVVMYEATSSPLTSHLTNTFG